MHEVFVTEHVILSSEQWSSLTWGHFRDLWGSQFQLLNSSQILWLNALNVVPLTWLKIFRRINQISADFQYLQTLSSPCNKIMHLWFMTNHFQYTRCQDIFFCKISCTAWQTCYPITTLSPFMCYFGRMETQNFGLWCPRRHRLHVHTLVWI